jgi:hypothetical protein
MAEESYTGSGDADDTDELLYTGQELLSYISTFLILCILSGCLEEELMCSSLTDGEDNRSMLDLNPLPLRLDPCDLLMDSIDVQLSRLQVS